MLDEDECNAADERIVAQQVRPRRLWVTAKSFRLSPFGIWADQLHLPGWDDVEEAGDLVRIGVSRPR